MNAINVMDSKSMGTESMEITIDLQQRDGFRDPVYLKKLQRAVDKIQNIDDANITLTNVVSLVDVVKELNRALNENRMQAYRIPDDRNLVSQELLLFEGSGRSDLEQLVDLDFSTTRLTLLVRKTDALYYKPYLDKVREAVESEFPDAKIELTGLLAIAAYSFSTLLSSMANSYFVLFFVTVPLMMILVRSFKMGCLSMVPNFFPLLFCLGMMVIVDSPLNIVSMLVGGIAIGVIVDDTIHFIHHFKQHYIRTNSVDIAVGKTIETTGKALLFTSVLFVIAGMIDIVATMPIFTTFGLFLALIITVAFLSDIILMPALVKVIFPDRSISS